MLDSSWAMILLKIDCNRREAATWYKFTSQPKWFSYLWTFVTRVTETVLLGQVNATLIQVMQVLTDTWRFFSSGKLCLMFIFSCMQSTMNSFLPMGYNSPWWILKEHKHFVHMGFIAVSPFIRFTHPSIHPSIHPWTFISQVGHKHLWKFIWHFHT